MKAQYSEIDEVISYIHRNIYEPLSLSDLAKYAGYSPFHFTRIFKEKMGLPPSYYVSSVRLQKAKDLLLQTNLTVRDVAMEVGQQSLGTFTSKFSERVGVTPAQFRHSTIQVTEHLKSLQSLDTWDEPVLQIGGSTSTIIGHVEATTPFEGLVLIGLFPKPIPEGIPLNGTLISFTSKHNEFKLSGIKPGTYYLMATSVSWSMGPMDVLLPSQTLRTRSKEPIYITGNEPSSYQRVKLHEPHPDDPPILISLPLLMNTFLYRVMKNSNP
ncbi:helix-turn-helix transcriptional regulator [Bacillus horti]|uniref:AraC-like DNA-binding protein n=1 Tax=Caldalkalibacillus horti TaxID=77523 RepID=A0ABT9VYB7_9BACI|nr:AraC family transcriptional regulator [Bacillus horti]MDQ0165976.1 AraC-like DNA-binding protein [Bacillus horti]